MRSRSPFVLAVSTSVLAVWVAAQSSAPDSLGRLVDLGQLPVPAPGVHCRQFASTDPSGAGEDHGHYLQKRGDAYVLAEMPGPGVIVRLWSANAAGRLRVFLDGEAEPRIDGPFQDLFTGAMPPFAPPIATHAGGGWISYFPIPYAKACRVEVSELQDPRALYYHVQYLTYPAATPMRTFTRELPPSEREALARVLALWRAGTDPAGTRPEAGGTSRDLATSGAAGGAPVEIAPGDRHEVFARDAAGTIMTLRLGVSPPTAAALRGLELIAAWDGNEPSIRAPVGDFFACGFGATPYRGLALGWDEGSGYCRLPMPFSAGARVWLHNRGTEPVVVRPFVRASAREAVADDIGRPWSLHAEFRSVDMVGDAKYEVASIEGPGKFVGVTQTLQGVGDLWYLEGNEEFFVDGEAAPSILGTGTEDFYNGGWYWDSGPLALPLHGLGVKQEWTTNRTTPWRMFVPDAVPFSRRLVVRIEHGSRNAVRDAAYASVAFWYGPPRPVPAIDAGALRVPRLWVARPPAFTGAADLAWDPATPVRLRTWQELTATHRGLERPLFQAFPESHVEHDAPAVDARVAQLEAGGGERTWRARIEAPWADRFRLELRLLAAGALPRVQIDGDELALTGAAKTEALPLRQVRTEPVGLAAGAHELAFSVTAGGPDPLGVDALRLVPASPFVRTWCVGPPVPAPPGTVEAEPGEEARFLSADFDAVAAGWRRLEAGDDRLDLNREVSPRSPMLAYLQVFVHAPEARTVRVLLGSDDGVRLWVGGELYWSREVHRHLTPDEDRFDVPLLPGWNRVLLKVKNDYGGYGVALRFADRDGTLRFAATR